MRLTPFLVLLAAACSHTEPYVPEPTGIDGPFSSAAPIRLTYDARLDSAASLSDDGSGVLYLYGTMPSGDQCIAMLPTQGGTRTWDFCDTRTSRADSGRSFSAMALAADGRILYQQAMALRGRDAPDRTVLWLAHRDDPLARRALVSFPINLGGEGISWLRDARWSGAESFTAAAGRLLVQKECDRCPLDTTVTPVALVRGTITASGATLALLPGTEGARFHAAAEGGTSFVFLRDGQAVHRVPATGGTATLVGNLPTTGTVTGISCQGSLCVVTQRIAEINAVEVTRIYRIRLATNAIELVTTVTGRWAGPVLLPTGGDVVMQASTVPSRDLFLFKGLLP